MYPGVVNKLPVWLQWLFFLFWIFMIGFMAIGGYFMFRKFLKALPKKDGKSELDWQNYYIEKTLHLWTEEHKELLNELISPVPEMFRDAAKSTIAGKIGKIALEENASQLKREHIIKGYIIATPKRDRKFLIKKCQELQIDLTPYKNLL